MVKSQDFYHIGFTTIPEIDADDPPQIVILMPRWYDPNTSPYRILCFRYERYVAVFDMGSINSRPMLKCVYDVVFQREDYARSAFKSRISNLAKQHYFNHYSILENASGRRTPVSQTLHDMLATVKTEKIIRGIKMPANSKSNSRDNLLFLNAKINLMTEILNHVPERDKAKEETKK